ncbi:MAG TPA: hypothetical protein PLP61_02580 [Nocardioides sp.]|uniref:hypothetical protein n=1 Tax=Nocardioides sp. TaxID=35761 RepID=UPI002C5D6025|nr:hypothetical protein [Nocardioides sp.]HQR25902.1 hypothetical protein [Nocardioides sp.]
MEGRLASRTLAPPLLGLALATFALVGVLGPSAAVPATDGFRWLDAHPSAPLTVGLTWFGLAAGGAGIWFGLRATARGWAPAPRRLLLLGCASVAVLALLPVAGSTDALMYAQLGRLDALGFDPAATPPRELVRLGDPVAAYQPEFWRLLPSAYGPVANAMFGTAARLGGTSVAQIVLVHKVLMACCFVGTGILLQRVAGPSLARQRRVHLLWTLNPLMIWATVVAAHVDAAASFLVVAGLVAVVRRRRAPLLLAALAGALLGGAAAVKAPYLLAGAGAVWGLRRQPRESVSALVGLIAVVVTAYSLAGKSALDALARRTQDVASIYQWRPLVRGLEGAGVEVSPRVFLVVSLVLVVLLGWRLPRPDKDLAVVRPMLVLSLAWLLATPMWRPWYDALMFPLLGLMPASQLDGFLLLRNVIGGIGTSPGAGPPVPWLRRVFNPLVVGSALLVTFLVLVARLAWRPFRGTAP